MSIHNLTIKDGKAKFNTQPKKVGRFSVTLTGNSDKHDRVSIQFAPNPNVSFCAKCGETREIDIGEVEINGFEVSIAGLDSGEFTLETFEE